jgi:hypothetical protein
MKDHVRTLYDNKSEGKEFCIIWFQGEKDAAIA